MAQKSQACQLVTVGYANAWTVTQPSSYQLLFYRDDLDGYTAFINVRVGKKGQVTAVSSNDGHGVIFTPRVGKFREVCVELSKKVS